MIVSASTPNGNPNPGPAPFEIVFTTTESSVALAICGASPCCAWPLTAICVDESVDPEYVNRKSCMHRRKKIAATSLYLQAKNLDFGLAGNL